MDWEMFENASVLIDDDLSLEDQVLKKEIFDSTSKVSTAHSRF